MGATRQTIKDIFNGSRTVEVPFFQRSYVWGEDHWERLLLDMEQAAQNSKPYFLGVIILKQQATGTGMASGDIRTVIDGQQRLTTLYILLKVLYLKTNKNYIFNKEFTVTNGDIALQHNHNDVSDFKKIVSLDKDVKIDGTSKIVEAYNYFRDSDTAKKLDTEELKANMKFVVIDLGADEDEQQMFDTINSLGVRLTTAELLKNYFFDKKDIESYEENWKEIFEKDEETKTFWDKEITAGRIKRNNIDLFFSSFLQIKLHDPELKVNANDKKNLSKVVGLFNSYKEFIEKYPIPKPKLIQEIKEYAVLYKDSINFNIVKQELTEKYGIARINAIIFGLENTTLIPYVLYVLKNAHQNEQEGIFMYLESYIMRRIVAPDVVNKNYNKLFSEHLISNEILSKPKLKEIIEKKSDKVNHMPSDAELEIGFKESKLINKQSSGVLYLIESRIRNRRAHGTELHGIKGYSLEHVMPKKWRNHWDKLDTEQEEIKRDKILLTLGNLTIITSSLNASIRDASWQKKKGKKDEKGLNRYASGIDTFSEFLDKEEWDEDIIEERAKFLFKEAAEVWKL